MNAYTLGRALRPRPTPAGPVIDYPDRPAWPWSRIVGVPVAALLIWCALAGPIHEMPWEPVSTPASVPHYRPKLTVEGYRVGADTLRFGVLNGAGTDSLLLSIDVTPLVRERLGDSVLVESARLYLYPNHPPVYWRITPTNAKRHGRGIERRRAAWVPPIPKEFHDH